jgi:ribosomal RNA methyltransferase Nop2
MKNTGELYANDATKDRIPSLIANLHRMGVNNCIVTNYDGQIMKEHVRGFDRILLDAPCTGLGVVSKDPSVKV